MSDRTGASTNRPEESGGATLKEAEWGFVDMFALFLTIASFVVTPLGGATIDYIVCVAVAIGASSGLSMRAIRRGGLVGYVFGGIALAMNAAFVACLAFARASGH